MVKDWIKPERKIINSKIKNAIKNIKSPQKSWIKTGQKSASSKQILSEVLWRH